MEQILIVLIAFQINIFELRKLRNFLVDPMQITAGAVNDIYQAFTLDLLAGDDRDLSSAFLADGIALSLDRRTGMRAGRKRSAA